MGWKDSLKKEEKKVATIEPIDQQIDNAIKLRSIKLEPKKPVPRIEPEPEAEEIEETEEEITEEPEETPQINTKKKIRRGKTYFDITGIITGLFIAMVILLLGSAYIYLPVPDLGTIYFVVVIMVGMIAWLPIGIPVGAIFIDTYLRCRFLRIVTKKNYGVVHIVSKGQRIVTLIKDLDESIIMRGDAIWGISKGYIYNISKKNLKLPILPKHIHYISNVPTIYLDYETMKPLSFHSEKTTISPKQLGSSLVGWAMVQKKKAIRQQKQINYMYLIIAILIVINMILTAQIYMIITGVTSG